MVDTERVLRCSTHCSELAAGSCRTCGGSFCEACLVWSYGPARPPHCVPCAVAAAAREPLIDLRDRSGHEAVIEIDGSAGPATGR